MGAFRFRHLGETQNRYGPDGCSASSRTYVTEQNAFKDGRPGHSVATYFERFVEQDGVWRRAFAFFQLHYMGSADLTGTFFQQPDFGPPPAMPPADAQTVTSLR